jgi:hypothetical protein
MPNHCLSGWWFAPVLTTVGDGGITLHVRGGHGGTSEVHFAERELEEAFQAVFGWKRTAGVA